jgi:hypothetical protein
MKHFPSLALAASAWASIILEAWLLLVRAVPADALSWGLWGVFWFIAVAASASYAAERK